ncbi:MAG: S24/S26 family peptidase [Bacteroidales bacterium]|nr:S24/S26 family peptidase [Bacteroidales bacterium]
MTRMVVNNDEFFAQVLERLDEGLTATIPVKGYSMLPFIRGGKDLVVLEKAIGDIGKDDIVLFHYGGRYVMHRVLKAEGNRFDIQGDGVWLGHEFPRREQILAKATFILRAGKKPVDPYSRGQLRLVHLWQRLGRLRRYILFIYRHLPWNRGWLKENQIQTYHEN